MSDNGEVTITRARYEADQNAEAELARLRKPVEGEVGEVVKKTRAHADMYEGATRERLNETADLIQRLVVQFADAEQAARVEASERRRQMDRAIAAEDRLREAVEVMEAITWFDWSDNDQDAVEKIDRARAFLSKLKDHSNG